jgi:U3 small nucleolar RNA-associated protein 21
MTLLLVGPETPHEISFMAMDGDAIWIASGPHAIKYIRGKEVQRITNILGSSLTSLTIFGTSILALSDEGSRMFVWDMGNGVLRTIIQFEAGFTARLILHPSTYLNKVLVASTQGSMELWNIQSSTRIFNFSASSLSPSQGTSLDSFLGKSISTLVQSPAIDVAGIGFMSGEIFVHDIRTDERLLRMRMEGGAIRALAFRSDGHPILVSACSTGHLAVWDLNSGGRLLHMIRGAHDGPITSAEWIPGQPVLVTAGEDNSVKQWLFDSPSAMPRLLKYRAGHHAPPHLIRYYGEDGKQLLTASRDRSLRCTSVVRDSRSFELSQGSLAKKASSSLIPVSSLKFPVITSLAWSSARSKDWDDILSVHSDEGFARSWTLQNKKIGKHVLEFDQPKKGGKDPLRCTAICVTACGNFGLAGSSVGHIKMWNMQSGLGRKTFDIGSQPRHHNPDTTRKKPTRSITGLAVDSLNTTVIASILDGTLYFFDFHTTKLVSTLAASSSVTSISLQRDSGLLAVVCDDMIVHIVDIETKNIVRQLGGFAGSVLDIAFSPDSRWLVACSLDSVIRTFDLPSGRLVDAFRTSSVATSIAFSPCNDFLATSHVDSVGVYLWANRVQYGDVSIQSVSEIRECTLPSMQNEDDYQLADFDSLTLETPSLDPFSTPEQLDSELITLTLLPRSRWQTLLNIDIIQQRNKPKEPPKAPEKAPFFLPTLPGTETRFQIKTASTPEQVKPSRRLDKLHTQTQRVFLQKLMDEPMPVDYATFFDYAKILSPAALDLEIRTLTNLDHLRRFINALIGRLMAHKDFEAVQAFQAVFLRAHGEIIAENPELLDDLERLKTTQFQQGKIVLNLISSSLGTLGFVRDLPT